MRQLVLNRVSRPSPASPARDLSPIWALLSPEPPGPHTPSSPPSTSLKSSPARLLRGASARAPLYAETALGLGLPEAVQCSWSAECRATGWGGVGGLPPGAWALSATWQQFSPESSNESHLNSCSHWGGG